MIPESIHDLLACSPNPLFDTATANRPSTVDGAAPPVPSPTLVDDTTTNPRPTVAADYDGGGEEAAHKRGVDASAEVEDAARSTVLPAFDEASNDLCPTAPSSLPPPPPRSQKRGRSGSDAVTETPKKKRKRNKNEDADADADAPPKKRQKNPGGKIKQRCCFFGCDNNNNNATLQRITPLIREDKKPSERSKIDAKKSYYRKSLQRRTTLERCGVRDAGKEYRVCHMHEKETIEESITVDHKGRKVKLTFEMVVPKRFGDPNELKEKRKKDALMKRTITKLAKIVDSSATSRKYGINEEIKRMLGVGEESPSEEDRLKSTFKSMEWISA